MQFASYEFAIFVDVSCQMDSPAWKAAWEPYLGVANDHTAPPPPHVLFWARQRTDPGPRSHRLYSNSRSALSLNLMAAAADKQEAPTTSPSA